MKTQNSFFVVILAVTLLSFSYQSNDNPILSVKKLDANQVNTAFTNYGYFNYGINGAHFEYPNGSGNQLRGVSGLWLGARVGSDTLVTVTGEYLPGYIDNNGNPQGKDDPLFKVYKIVQGDTTSEDYLSWPVSQGAYINSLGKPYLLGAQTLFYSYTDGYIEAHNGTLPLKAQILQTDWAYNLNGPLGNAVFSEFRIINRSSQVWNDSYIGFWTDDDIGQAIDNGVCSDSSINLGYTFSTGGLYPYAVGTKILSGPFKFTGNNSDSVVYFAPPSSNNRIVKIGYENLYSTVCNYYNNTAPPPSDPLTVIESYRVLQGLWRDGSHWINPNTNGRTNYPCSSGGSDRRFLLSSGPLMINPGDTQIVVIAQLAARSITFLQSIVKLKRDANSIQQIFNNNFNTVSINNNTTQLPDGYKLEQNYPNPFNPNTAINYELRVTSFVNLKVYDINGKEVVTLVNQKQNAGNYSVVFKGENLPSGIYFYKLTVNNLSVTLKMTLLK